MRKYLFVISVLFVLCSCNSPKNNGEKIAKMYNESVENFINDKENVFEDFITNFEKYGFTTRIDARNEIVVKIDKLIAKYENDIASADYTYEKALRECEEWDDLNDFKTEFNQTLNENIDIDKILEEAYNNPNVDRLIYTIIPQKPSEEKVKADIVGHVINGNEYTNIKWTIEKGEIKELEILNISNDKDGYIYDVRLVVQADGGALESYVEIRYELGKNDDWTIQGVLSKELNYVITGKYDKYIEAKTISSGIWDNLLYIENNYDKPLAIGGKIRGNYGSWEKFYIIVPGNTMEKVTWWEVIDYKIDFVELPH